MSDARAQSLDTAIAELDSEVRASSSPRLTAAWRAQWRAFVARWRDELADLDAWGDRVSAAERTKRVDAFGDAYQQWEAEYEAAGAVTSSTSESSATWLILGAAALVLLTGRP